MRPPTHTNAWRAFAILLLLAMFGCGNDSSPSENASPGNSPPPTDDGNLGGGGGGTGGSGGGGNPPSPGQPEEPIFVFVALQEFAAHRSSDYEIGALRFDPSASSFVRAGDGQLPDLVPNGLEVHPSRKFLYSSNTPCCPEQEMPIGWGWHIDGATANLSSLPGTPFEAGSDSLDLALHPSGRFAYYVGTHPGIHAFQLNSDTGSPSELAGSPFATGGYTQVVADPSGNWIFAASFNTIESFRVDAATGALHQMAVLEHSSISTDAELAADPEGQFLYITDPTANTVWGYRVDSTTGVLTAVPGSPFATGNYPSEMTINATAEFIYVANRSENSISGFRIERETGTLTPLSGFPHKLPADERPGNAGSRPMDILASHGFVFVSSFGPVQTSPDLIETAAGSVLAFTVDASTGALTQAAKHEFDFGEGPTAMGTTP